MSLLRHSLPCLIPLIISLDLIRRIMDEEISKQNLLTGISKGGDPELSFIKVPPVTKKAAPILTVEEKRLLKEKEYLDSLPLAERQYLLDMRLVIREEKNELYQLIDQEGK